VIFKPLFLNNQIKANGTHGRSKHTFPAGRSETVGSGARTDQNQALQPSHRRAVCALDQALHCFPRQAPPKGDGGRGSGGVFDAFGGGQDGFFFDAKPGFGGFIVSLQGGSGHPTALAGESDAGEAAGALADGAFPRGGLCGAGADRGFMA
jgi:hypothetical protein